MLIMITGLPGSGKTTFAQALAKSINAQHLNRDTIRASMGKRGQNNESLKSIVYAKMLKQTESHLHRGEDMVVEATFHKAALRKPYTKLAKKYKKQLFWILVTAAEAIILERIQQKDSSCNLSFEFYQTIKDIYEPLEAGHLILHSDNYGIEKMVVKAKEYLSLASFQISP